MLPTFCRPPLMAPFRDPGTGKPLGCKLAFVSSRAVAGPVPLEGAEGMTSAAAAAGAVDAAAPAPPRSSRSATGPPGPGETEEGRSGRPRLRLLQAPQGEGGNGVGTFGVEHLPLFAWGGELDFADCKDALVLPGPLAELADKPGVRNDVGVRSIEAACAAAVAAAAMLPLSLLPPKLLLLLPLAPLLAPPLVDARSLQSALLPTLVGETDASFLGRRGRTMARA